MADATDEARLVEEHPDELVVQRELRVQALDGDRAREADRADQAPEVDRGHAARRDGVADRVASDDARRLPSKAVPAHARERIRHSRTKPPLRRRGSATHPVNFPQRRLVPINVRGVEDQVAHADDARSPGWSARPLRRPPPGMGSDRMACDRARTSRRSRRRRRGPAACARPEAMVSGERRRARVQATEDAGSRRRRCPTAVQKRSFPSVATSDDAVLAGGDGPRRAAGREARRRRRPRRGRAAGAAGGECAASSGRRSSTARWSSPRRCARSCVDGDDQRRAALKMPDYARRQGVRGRCRPAPRPAGRSRR